MRTALITAKRAFSLFALAAVLAMLAVACGGEDEPTPTSRPAPAAEPTPTPEAMMEKEPTPTAEAMMEKEPTPTPEAMMEDEPTPTPQPRPTSTPIPVEEQVDFAGKTVQITVGYAPGGGFDTFARIFAAHLSDELRGNPNVFVSNKPGANTLVAVRSVTEKDYRDNQVDIVVIISTLIQQSILKGNVEGFDAASDVVYLGAPDYTPSDQTWCIRTDVADTLDEYFAGNYSIGLVGRVDTYATTNEWLAQAGFPLDRVFGYRGTSDIDAAFNRREVDITPTCRDSQVAQNPEWAEGFATPLFYTVVEPEWIKAGKAEGKWLWVDSVTNIASERLGANDALVNAFNALMEMSSSSRIYAMPAQTPANVVNEMRAAFERVVSSDEFVADMKSRRYDVGLRTGDQYQALVDGIADLPPERFEIISGLFPD